MTPTFDIDALRAVVAGLDLGSFARAAVQLGRSQSAVSMQLKKLEQQAGTALFVRRGRGLVPTAAGEALAAYARRILALNDEAALVLGAGCGGRWKALWVVCSGASNITVRYDDKTGCHPAGGAGCDYYVPDALTAQLEEAMRLAVGLGRLR